MRIVLSALIAVCLTSCGGKVSVSTGGGTQGSGATGSAGGTTGTAASGTLVSGTVLVPVPTALDLSSGGKGLVAKRAVSKGPAAQIECTIRDFLTGDLLGKGTTDKDGKFTIGVGALGSLTRCLVDCQVTASDTQGSYFEISRDVTTELPEFSIGDPVDPKSEKEWRAMAAYITSAYGSYSSGGPLPTSAAQAITGGTFEPTCYDDYLGAVLAQTADDQNATTGTEEMLEACVEAQDLAVANCSYKMSDLAKDFAGGTASSSTIHAIATCVDPVLDLTHDEIMTALETCNAQHKELGNLIGVLAGKASTCRDLKGKLSSIADVIAATDPGELVTLKDIEADDFFAFWSDEASSSAIAGVATGTGIRSVASFLVEASRSDISVKGDQELLAAVANAISKVTLSGTRDSLGDYGRVIAEALKKGGAAMKTLLADKDKVAKAAEFILNNASLLDDVETLNKLFDFAAFAKTVNVLGVDQATAQDVDQFLAGDTGGDGVAETAPPICRINSTYCPDEDQALILAGQIEPTVLNLAGTWYDSGTCISGGTATPIAVTGDRSPFTIKFTYNNQEAGGPINIIGNKQCGWIGQIPGIQAQVSCGTLACDDASISGSCTITQSNGSQTPCSLALTK